MQAYSTQVRPSSCSLATLVPEKHEVLQNTQRGCIRLGILLPRPIQPTKIINSRNMRLKFAVIKVMEKLSARGVKTAFPLLDLPNELIVYIIELIDHVPTLRRLACTSHRIQHLTEPVLWRELLLTTAPNVRRILAAYHTTPSRAKMLQVLNVPCDPYFGRDVSVLADLMEKAENVKMLTIQSPSCGEVSFETEAEWGPMTDHLFLPFQRAVAGPISVSNPLQKLTKREPMPCYCLLLFTSRSYANSQSQSPSISMGHCRPTGPQMPGAFPSSCIPP